MTKSKIHLPDRLTLYIPVQKTTKSKIHPPNGLTLHMSPTALPRTCQIQENVQAPRRPYPIHIPGPKNGQVQIHPPDCLTLYMPSGQNDQVQRQRPGLPYPMHSKSNEMTQPKCHPPGRLTLYISQIPKTTKSETEAPDRLTLHMPARRDTEVSRAGRPLLDPAEAEC